MRRGLKAPPTQERGTASLQRPPRPSPARCGPGLTPAVPVILPPLSCTTAQAQKLAPAILAATPPPPTSSVKLQVQSARNSTSPARNAPKALQNVGTYKWLINLDNTGKPEMGKDNALCHPSTNAPGGATPNGYPQGCNWPSVRYAVDSPG